MDISDLREFATNLTEHLRESASKRSSILLFVMFNGIFCLFILLLWTTQVIKENRELKSINESWATQRAQLPPEIQASWIPISTPVAVLPSTDSVSGSTPVVMASPVSPSPTATSSRTPTPTATSTHTPTPTATLTPTPMPTATSSPTPMPTATSTPKPKSKPDPPRPKTPSPATPRPGTPSPEG